MADRGNVRSDVRNVGTDGRRAGTGMGAAQTASASMGLLSTLIGIAGFIPGLTKHLGDIKFAGHDSGAMLFDRYQTSWLMNLLAIGIGLAGIAAARSKASSRGWLFGAGALMLVFWLYGMLTKNTSSANFVPFNTPRDWLNFGMGLTSMALGAVTSRSTANNTGVTARPQAYGH